MFKLSMTNVIFSAPWYFLAMSSIKQLSPGWSLFQLSSPNISPTKAYMPEIYCTLRNAYIHSHAWQVFPVMPKSKFVFRHSAVLRFVHAYHRTLLIQSALIHVQHHFHVRKKASILSRWDYSPFPLPRFNLVFSKPDVPFRVKYCHCIQAKQLFQITISRSIVKKTFGGLLQLNATKWASKSPSAFLY